jgi:hypothetical protein
VYGLKHQKEKRRMDHFAGLDVSVKFAHQRETTLVWERASVRPIH